MFNLSFTHALLLLLLPLALLPLLPSQRDTLAFPWLAWLPEDRKGHRLHRLWQCSAVVCMAATIFALAKPMHAESTIERIGRGAEISLLLDRSASMDSYIRRKINKNYQSKQKTQSKNDIARGALHWLLQQRPENRYALTTFHIVPMRITDFTDDQEVIRAGLDASAVGRGAKETNMGVALLAAIESFEGRPYTGSRALLLVSDGGARLSEDIRKKITASMQQHQVSLYFIYVQSGINNAKFDTVGTDTEALSDEITLHKFFQGLGTEYQVFYADNEESMAEAVAIIDQQQSQPLTYYERIPGTDYSVAFYVIALLSSVSLYGLSLLKMRSFQ